MYVCHVTCSYDCNLEASFPLVQAALDVDGKSPLAVCLECRMNDWEGTTQLLREAYKNPVYTTYL